MSQHDVSLPFPILLGDIGGTNARFTILENENAQPVEVFTVKTAEYASIDDAIQDAVYAKTSLRPRSAILAVAGPVEADEIPLTNCHWVVKPRVMIGGLGLAEVMVINDFEAQALAIAALASDERKRLGPHEVESHASRIVLGPGTGLGVAGLVYAQGQWVPVPGEGGHIDLGPRSERDSQIFPHIEKIGGRVSAEQILCGRGIVHLYKAICIADGIEPRFDDPADITSQALNKSNEQCVETLSLFITYLGRVAGDVALLFMARGGVYLAGGISQKIIDALEGPEFRAAFEDKAPHNELMSSIPSFVVTHPQAALAGLANYARSPKSFGLDRQGKYWSNAAQ
jgi:glucokinase